MAVGPKHMLAKLVVSLAIVAAMVLTFYQPMYHVKAPFQFVSTESRIVSAPMEGFIGDEVKVRPGDRVKVGDLLLAMDTTQLELQKLSKQSDAEAKRAAARAAGADPTKTAEARQYAKEAESAQAEADLYQAQIDKAIVKATIDGVVLSGDWREKRGTPVRKGEELFKIADPRALRVEMNVAERDIQQLKQDQIGWLATSSLPSDKKKFLITQIVPLGTPDQGANVFKVYGQPQEVDEQWRDGMQGEARVEIEHKRLGWIWTHRLIEWVQLKTWWF
jgi:multidrug efflux pump subunit AcrA (membrane-fusion protein)